MASAELYSKFASFPNEDHVQNVCKPGQGAETCRYLAVGPSGFLCEKAGSLRGILDERAEKGELGARGDNCAGKLGFVVENQGVLMGKKTVYRETGFNDKAGVFTGVKVNAGLVSVGELVLKEDITAVTVSPGGITFSGRGLGTFLGTETVLFEDSATK